MPKKPIVKSKPAPKSQSNSKVVSPPPQKVKDESPRIVIFKLFECLTKLEMAEQLIGQVGIFPGEKAETLKRQTAETRLSVNNLIKQYREEWFKMKGETGE